MAVAIVAIGLFLSMQMMVVEGAGSSGDVMVGKMDTASKSIVLIGASYAGGWDPGRSIAGFRTINKGVSGQQSFEMLARFDNDVLVLKPDAVIIWGFINDVFRSDPAQIEQTLKRARESIVAMVELARKAGIVPILATEVTIRGKDGWEEALQTVIGRIMGKTSYQDYVNGHVAKINRWVRDLASREGLVLLDFESVLADQDGIRRKEFARPDGSHISLKGYEALTQYVEMQLRSSDVFR